MTGSAGLCEKSEMAVPPYQDLMLPLLKSAQDGQERSVDACGELLAAQFKLTPDDLKERLPSGKQTIFDNRVGWASTYLKKAKLLESPARGLLKITDRGLEVLSSEPSRIDRRFLTRFPEFVEFISQKRPEASEAVTQVDEQPDDQRTPEELLENAYQGLRRQLAHDLLDRIKKSSPKFFERLVVDLFVGMGYGGSRKDAGRAVGQSGDEGIDGIIDEDRLGLDKVYIQAKPWDNPVGRPVIQAFAGSLEGHRAIKGVLITTSDFTREARDYVDRIQKRIVLIDGQSLAKLMIDFNVGVNAGSNYEVKKIDLDYFGGEE